MGHGYSITKPTRVSLLRSFLIRFKFQKLFLWMVTNLRHSRP